MRDTQTSGPVIFLHGKGNTGLSFQTKMKPFVDDLSTSSTCTFLTSPTPGEWWKLKEGERSGQALSYPGYKDSESLVLEAIRSSNPRALLGQSQGAILLFSMIARGVLRNFKGNIVLNGIQFPKPFACIITEAEKNCEIMFTGKLLLLIGTNDEISPPAGAMKCYESLSKLCQSVEICEHDGGHSVPIFDDAASLKIKKHVL